MAAVNCGRGRSHPVVPAAKAATPRTARCSGRYATGSHVRGYGSGRNAYHLAVDIAGPLGADVLAAAPASWATSAIKCTVTAIC